MMDVFRSRLFWSVCVVVSLGAIFSIFVYYAVKESAEGDVDDESPPVVTGPEIAVKRKQLLPPTPKISQYNPLEGFHRTTDWSEFRTNGDLSASAADFKKEEECRRVVVFLGKGAILGHILTACDSMEPSMGLMMVDDMLYYYGRAMETQGPGKDNFTVAKKIIGERKCLVTSYTVNGEESPKVEDKSGPKEVAAYQNIYCKVLVNFKMPPMLLLSRNGRTGMFSPSKSSYWATINPWEAVGAATRLYWYGARCFRLLVITSFGRSVQAVKVSCGPVQNLVVTDNTLNYDDALVVKRDSEADTFDIIYNSKRSGSCFKKVVSLSSKKSVVSTVLKGNLSPQHNDCQDLVKGKIPRSTLDKDEVNQLVKKLQLNSFDVEPYGTSLKDYVPYSQWSHFNLPMDLGLAVMYYKKGKDSLTMRKLLLVVARGVPLAGVLVDPGPVQRLVIRDDVLYHDKSIMLMKTKDEDKFTSLIKVDEYNCFKKSYLVKNESGISVKEELPSWGKVTKSMDEDCRDLIDGNKLKNPEFGKLGAETDDAGVPTDLPPGVNVSESTSADKGKENGSPTI